MKSYTFSESEHKELISAYQAIAGYKATPCRECAYLVKNILQGSTFTETPRREAVLAKALEIYNRGRVNRASCVDETAVPETPEQRDTIQAIKDLSDDGVLVEVMPENMKKTALGLEHMLLRRSMLLQRSMEYGPQSVDFTMRTDYGIEPRMPSPAMSAEERELTRQHFMKARRTQTTEPSPANPASERDHWVAGALKDYERLRALLEQNGTRDVDDTVTAVIALIERLNNEIFGLEDGVRGWADIAAEAGERAKISDLERATLAEIDHYITRMNPEISGTLPDRVRQLVESTKFPEISETYKPSEDE